jgi:hypothetical protein
LFLYFIFLKLIFNYIYILFCFCLIIFGTFLSTFKVKLIDFPEGVYDVKIDILENGERIAKILNNEEWESTWYFIKDIISSEEEKEFSIKITESATKGNITIKIRDSSDTSKTFTDYNISIKNETTIPEENPSKNNLNENNTSQENLEENSTDKEEINEEKPKEKISYESDNTQPEQKEEVKESEIENKQQLIRLTTKAIDNKEDKNYDKSNYATYCLIGFCVVLIVIFLSKYVFKIELRKFKNEFD